MLRKTDARLPRPCPVIAQGGYPGDDDEEAGDSGAGNVPCQGNVDLQPGLLPAPIRAEDSPGPDGLVIAPYADFLHYSQVPEVPRKLLEDKQEIQSQQWPLPAPEEMNSKQQVKASQQIPAVFFAKRHRFTVFNYSDLLQSDKSPSGSFITREDDEIIRFTELSSKVDYCIRVKNTYEFTNEVCDDRGIFKDAKPRICAVCTVKTKASMLPDLRHKYRFTFFHTIHVYSPPGLEVQSSLTLDEKSRIEPLSIMKICPTGRKTEKLKPEIVTLLQVTHFVRVLSCVMPDCSPAMMPRPLPPEFREPRLIIIDEDLHGKAPPEPQPEPCHEDTPAPETFTHRPGRSEPPEEEEEEEEHEELHEES